MSIMAIAWVRMLPGVNWDAEPSHFIDVVIEREPVTTGGATEISTVAPAGADAAIVTAVDAALIVVTGDVTVDAATTLGVDVALGAQAYFRVVAGETYVAGIEQ